MDTERQKAGGTRRQNGTLQKNGLAVGGTTDGGGGGGGGGGADSAVVAAAGGEMMQKVSSHQASCWLGFLCRLRDVRLLSVMHPEFRYLQITSQCEVQEPP